ncbi:MAG: hypothetical protein HYZ37_09165 [Candidatus Solibacter usitatus]|nr:hypothetical protein [Candidatus Solibacter usitatus]
MAWRAGFTYWLYACVSILGALATLLSVPNLRYIYAALPLFSVAVAYVFAKQRSAVFVAAAVAILNLICFGTAGFYHKDFVPNIFKSGFSGSYIRYHSAERQLIDILNATGVRSPVAFLGDNKVAGLNAQALSHSWHCDAFSKSLHAANSPRQVERVLAENKVEFLIAPRKGTPAQLPSLILNQFLDEFTTPVARAGNLYIARRRNAQTNP